MGDAAKEPGRSGGSRTGGPQTGGPRTVGKRPGGTDGTDAKAAKGGKGGSGAAGSGSRAAGQGSAGGADWGPFPRATAARGGVYALLVVLGVLVGTAGTLLQAAWFPAGLLLALAGAVGLFWGGAKLCRTKVGAAAPGGAWTVTVLLMTSSRPEGDFLFAAGLASYIFLFGGILAAVMCTTIALPVPPVPADKYR